MSVISNAFSRSTTRASASEPRISLEDNTQPAELPLPEHSSKAEINEPLPNGLKKTQTKAIPARLRQGISKRKYAKYSEQRYTQDSNDNALADSSISTSKSGAVPEINVVQEDAELGPLTKSRTSVDQLMRRGQQKIKGLLNLRNNLKGAGEGNTEIDVLYENQRGSWFFGTPLYSSKSLLNFDPSAWTTANMEPSSVNITNAQLPDPSWEWAWKTWYVDMSSDVDEQGWQYSLLFSKQTAWHGTHPWFHSFVRRRRWLRKRIRSNTAVVLQSQSDETQTGGVKDKHKLNADYFSVHPAAVDNKLPSASTNVDRHGDGVPAGDDNVVEFDHDHNEEPYNLPTLLRLLKESTLDREKINLVLAYMEQDSEDNHYLADEIPHIMAMLVYQHSKRQLLASMLNALDMQAPESKTLQESSLEAKADQEGSGKRLAIAEHDADNPDGTDRRRQKYENLVKAAKAADHEIRNLQYWSDVRHAEQHAESLGTAEALTAA